MADQSQPQPIKMDVKMMTALVPIHRDEDGTPMYKGERLVEVEPGRWMTPDAKALMDFLESASSQLTALFPLRGRLSRGHAARQRRHTGCDCEFLLTETFRRHSAQA